MIESSGPLPPNATIGIVGGGQLGRMLSSSAAKLGFRTLILEPQADCPAAQTSNGQINADYDDINALDRLANASDVVTYEFENVPLAAAEHLASKVALYPPPRALEVAQDRVIEKQFLNGIGVATTDYAPVEDAAALQKALSDFGGGILKTCRFGYDGKGQHRFDSGGDQALESLATILDQLVTSDCILERIVPFEREFSIVAARDKAGTIVAFDPAENIHRNGILHSSTLPAGIRADSAEQAFSATSAIMSALEHVGVIGVEFFETGDGVLVNEIAPRVHNTGHWTVEACAISQFEQHIRAVTGLPLGDGSRHSDCEMVNLLGSEADSISSLLKNGNTQVTLYGKQEPRPGRKMGHYTRLLPPVDRP